MVQQVTARERAAATATTTPSATPAAMQSHVAGESPQPVSTSAAKQGPPAGADSWMPSQGEDEAHKLTGTTRCRQADWYFSVGGSSASDPLNRGARINGSQVGLQRRIARVGPAGGVNASVLVGLRMTNGERISESAEGNVNLRQSFSLTHYELVRAQASIPVAHVPGLASIAALRSVRLQAFAGAGAIDYRAGYTRISSGTLAGAASETDRDLALTLGAGIEVPVGDGNGLISSLGAEIASTNTPLGRRDASASFSVGLNVGKLF